MKKKAGTIKGMSLVALVVSIIVLLILAGVTINLTIGNNGIISRTILARKEQEVATIKESLILQSDIQESGMAIRRYMNTDEVDNVIHNNAYKHKIGIYRGELVYLGDEQTEEAAFLKIRGFNTINMTPEEFKYYIELGVLEDSIKEHTNIGRKLQTSDFSCTIQIGDNNYGTGWCLIGNYTDEEKQNNTYQFQFDKLELKDTTHSPYLANYTTGVVLSIDGMPMYQSQVTIHSFNDNYDENIANSITYVNSFTNKTGETFGNLISTSLYTGRVDNYGGGMKIYSDNNGLLEYDEHGALILDSDNAIPVLEIDNNFNIKDNYTINVTVEGDYTQDNAMAVDGYANTIVALSDSSSRYLSWIGVYKGFLQVYSYYSGASLKNIVTETTRTGFATVDLSQYQNSPINIQVTATRGEKTKIYINGELKRTFDSGSNSLSFQYTTIGDLRVGRNLKFIGKIYEFGIYDIVINETGIQSNWERAQTYVNK